LINTAIYQSSLNIKIININTAINFFALFFLRQQTHPWNIFHASMGAVNYFAAGVRLKQAAEMTNKPCPTTWYYILVNIPIDVF